MVDELISRQMAIDKINERQRKLIYCFGFENDMVKIMNIAKSIITAIPSVQPGIVRCEDCKYYRRCDDQDDLCVYTMTSVKTDDYCSYGERREDAERENNV